MEPGSDYQEQLQRLKEMVEALRNQEVDSVIGSKHVLLLRIKETEEALTEQRGCLERLLSERTQLFEELKAKQELLVKQGELVKQDEARLLMATSFPVFILAETDQEARYTWIKNPHPDFDPTAVIGRRDDEISPCKDARLLTELKRKVLRTATVERTEFSIGLSDGRRYYDIFLRPRFDSDGKVVGLSTAAIDITQRKEMEEELRQHRDHLECLVRERTSELRDLSHRLITAQEDERNLIGNELHDQIGQHLTYTSLLLEQMARMQGLKESPELLAARGAVQDAIGKIRNLSNLLSPRLLRSSGLIVALDSLIEEYIRNTRILVGFHHEVDIDALPKELALACFRIIQESLTNIARHAKAGKVEVHLISLDNRLHLEISDDGTGFDAMKVEHSTGLTGMRERALALGGELVISSMPGQGTRITADFLLERSNGR